MSDKENMSDEHVKISQIRELYDSLSNEGKDRFVQTILENEEFMGRLLGVLMNSEGNVMQDDGNGGFVDFLRKVRE